VAQHLCAFVITRAHPASLYRVKIRKRRAGGATLANEIPLAFNLVSLPIL